MFAPHVVSFAPMFVGTIKDGDNPLAEVKLELKANAKDILFASSDMNGNFQIGPIKEMQLFWLLGGELFASYELHITYLGDQYLGYAFGNFGGAPAKIFLICDVSKRENYQQQQGFCEMTEESSK